MSVYVDELLEYPLGIVPGAPRAKYWCHLFADDLQELHALALSIGMRRSWFQEHANLPHYDLTQSRRALALRLGAIEQRL